MEPEAFDADFICVQEKCARTGYTSGCDTEGGPGITPLAKIDVDAFLVKLMKSGYTIHQARTTFVIIFLSSFRF